MVAIPSAPGSDVAVYVLSSIRVHAHKALDAAEGAYSQELDLPGPIMSLSPSDALQQLVEAQRIW